MIAIEEARMRVAPKTVFAALEREEEDEESNKERSSGGFGDKTSEEGS
jgi:hypothetical protein